MSDCYDRPGVLERYREAAAGVGDPRGLRVVDLGCGDAAIGVEDHLSALRRAGFALTALRECPPRRERFGGDEAEYARRRRIPRFLLLAAVAS